MAANHELVGDGADILDWDSRNLKAESWAGHALELRRSKEPAAPLPPLSPTAKRSKSTSSPADQPRAPCYTERIHEFNHPKVQSPEQDQLKSTIAKTGFGHGQILSEV